MNNWTKLVFVVFAALAFASCGGTAENKPANGANTANTNAAKPTAAAPTVDALFAQDKLANEAFIKGDAKYFESFLSDKFVSFEMGQRMDRAGLLKMVADMKCDVKTWSLDDPHMVMLDADTYVVSYKGTWDGTCNGPDGKAMKLPSPVRAASVYVRSGDKWQGAFHAETMIIDPKNPPPAPPKTDAKKEEPKKEDAKPADKPTAGDANTDALVKIHTSGWEAFKARDAKKFEEITTANLSVVDPIGTWFTGKAAVIKQWVETMKCEGMTTVKLSDGIATAISPTVEVLTVKGNVDGTCDGRKNGDLYHAAIYVKEGDAWKLAFVFESAPPPAK